MSVEGNLKIIEEWAEAISARDLDRILGMYAEDVVSHDPSLSEPVRGIEAHRAWEKRVFEAFGDVKATVVNSFGQGDWVVAEEIVEITHTGTLLGRDGAEVPPTHNTARSRVVEVFKIEGGKITEVHAYYDQLALMAQLGLVHEDNEMR